jgi:hypothetical protein
VTYSRSNQQEEPWDVCWPDGGTRLGRREASTLSVLSISSEGTKNVAKVTCLRILFHIKLKMSTRVSKMCLVAP